MVNGVSLFHLSTLDYSRVDKCGPNPMYHYVIKLTPSHFVSPDPDPYSHTTGSLITYGWDQVRVDV